MKVKLAAAALIITVAGGLVWQWRSAVDDAATARQQATELRQALRESEAEAAQARQTIDQLNAAVEAQREQARRAQLARQEAMQRLADMEADNEAVAEWSSTDVPDDVRSWLRDQRAGDPDGD